MDTVLHWLSVAGNVLAAASALAWAIARLTKSQTDDRVAGWLDKLHDLLAGLGLHGTSLADKRTVYRVKSANSAAEAVAKEMK